MTQLSLTYFDVNGNQKSITHIMQDFTDVKTFLNGNGSPGGGNLDATNTAAAFAKDNVEPAFANWKTINTTYGFLSAPTSAGTYYFDAQNEPVGSGNNLTRSAQAGWFDPADWTAGSRTTKYRLTTALFTNGTAPAITFTWGLYPVTSGGGSNLLALTLGTVVSGSTVALAAPAANAVVHADGAAFTGPTAGGYAIGLVTSGTNATNSWASFAVRLQVQQV